MKDIERVPVLSLAQGWSVHYRMEREFDYSITTSTNRIIFITQAQQKELNKH